MRVDSLGIVITSPCKWYRNKHTTFRVIYLSTFSTKISQNFLHLKQFHFWDSFDGFQKFALDKKEHLFYHRDQEVGKGGKMTIKEQLIAEIEILLRRLTEEELEMVYQMVKQWSDRK